MILETLDEALLYEAEWWVSPVGSMPGIDSDTFDIAQLVVEYGYGPDVPTDYESMSNMLLLVREAIK